MVGNTATVLPDGVARVRYQCELHSRGRSGGIRVPRVLTGPKAGEVVGGGDGSLLAPRSKCRRCLSAPRDQHCFIKEARGPHLGRHATHSASGARRSTEPQIQETFGDTELLLSLPRIFILNLYPCRDRLDKETILQAPPDHNQTAYVVSAERHVPSTEKIKQGQWTHRSI